MASETMDGRRAVDNSASAYNARLGIVFFLLYFVLYAGFVLIATFKYEWMGRQVLAGLNLAIVYGMSLIVLAMLLAVVYMMMCRRDLPASAEASEI